MIVKTKRDALISTEKWYYLKNASEKNNARFIRCGSVVYEVTSNNYNDGRKWSIDEVIPLEIPPFTADE